MKEEMAKRAEIERASKERAKAKQQREEQERTSRAVAGVNHLEIPAELAFIYSKLDGNLFYRQGQSLVNILIVTQLPKTPMTQSFVALTTKNSIAACWSK